MSPAPSQPPAEVRWLESGQCGPNNPLADGSTPAECNPEVFNNQNPDLSLGWIALLLQVWVVRAGGRPLLLPLLYGLQEDSGSYRCYHQQQH